VTRPAALLLLAATLLAAPLDARAQLVGLGGHPMPSGPRPPHALSAESDAAAIGTIDAVELGRIRVRDALSLYGDVPPRFELKRAPSNPPKLEAGQRVLLLLRGARSPYLVVGDEREQLGAVADGAEARLGPALRALHDAVADPTRLRDLYLGWSDGGDTVLRSLAQRGLTAPDAPFLPLPPEIVVPRARRALDPTLPTPRRLDAAAIAVLSPQGAAALLGGVPVAGDPAGTQVLELALAGGLLREQGPAVEAALLRCLASPDAAVRRVALRYARGIATPPLRQAVARLAAGDPDPGVKQAAVETLRTTPGGA
jgi:hypothetical protein